jgi:hypothetical protein
LLQHFAAAGRAINGHSGKVTLNFLHQISQSHQAIIHRIFSKYRSVRNIPVAQKASVASSKDPLDFKSLSQVALLLQPNRALYCL